MDLASTHKTCQKHFVYFQMINGKVSLCASCSNLESHLGVQAFQAFRIVIPQWVSEELDLL